MLPRVFLVALLLTGCASQVPPATETEPEGVAQCVRPDEFAEPIARVVELERKCGPPAIEPTDQGNLIMPLTLRKATGVGFHYVAYFRDPAGVVDRVIFSDAEAARPMKSDLDETKEYLTRAGRSVRPRANSKMYMGVRQEKWDTPDGLLVPGDYVLLSTGELWIQRAHSDPTRNFVWVLEPNEFTGNPNIPNTLNVDVMVGQTRVQVIDGVLQ